MSKTDLIIFNQEYRRNNLRKVITCLLTSVISATVMFIFYSCGGGLPSEDETPNKNLLVDMGSYVVGYPAGDDWVIEKDKTKNMVTFTRYKKVWFNINVLGATIIQVYQNYIAADTFKLGETESAEHYIKNELEMMKAGEKDGGYEVEKYYMKDTVLYGKKFYCMFYEISGGNMWKGNDIVSENILAVYYPPDFMEKRIFYGFLISDVKRTGSLVGQRKEQIYPVIKSFRVK